MSPCWAAFERRLDKLMVFKGSNTDTRTEEGAKLSSSEELLTDELNDPEKDEKPSEKPPTKRG